MHYLLLTHKKPKYKLFFRHSGLFGFHIMKMNNKGKLSVENVVSNPLNKVNIIEIPLQSTTDDTQLEVLHKN